MATNVTLPELGENVNSGTVTSVLVKVGDTIAVDDPLLELETDKAVVEVPSSKAGVVTAISVEEGATLQVGGVILTLDATESSAAPKPAAKAEVAKVTPPPAPKPTPVEAEETVETPVPEPTTPPAKPTAAPVQASEPTKSKGPVRAAPSVRKLAREIGVEISDVPASKPDKGISIADVKAYAKSRLQENSVPEPSVSSPTPTSAQAVPLPNFEKWGTVSREDMSTIRKVTVQSMTRSWTTIPHVTQNDLADVTEMEKFRKRHGKAVQDAGGKLTATAILVKVLCEALKQFPQFNSSIDTDTSQIVLKQYYNIGIAVDTEHGLMVPNIKNVDQKGLTQIAVEMSQMSERARSRKIGLNELQGTCMTITNLGGIGGTSFTPIVNAPEVAILGVSRSRVEPVYTDGTFVPRTMMPLSLSYDHRVIDGAEAARFTRWVCEALEYPMGLSLEL